MTEYYTAGNEKQFYSTSKGYYGEGGKQIATREEIRRDPEGSRRKATEDYEKYQIKRGGSKKSITERVSEFKEIILEKFKKPEAPIVKKTDWYAGTVIVSPDEPKRYAAEQIGGLLALKEAPEKIMKTREQVASKESRIGEIYSHNKKVIQNNISTIEEGIKNIRPSGRYTFEGKTVVGQTIINKYKGDLVEQKAKLIENEKWKKSETEIVVEERQQITKSERSYLAAKEYGDIRITEEAAKDLAIPKPLRGIASVYRSKEEELSKYSKDIIPEMTEEQAKYIIPFASGGMLGVMRSKAIEKSIDKFPKDVQETYDKYKDLEKGYVMGISEEWRERPLRAGIMTAAGFVLPQAFGVVGKAGKKVASVLPKSTLLSTSGKIIEKALAVGLPTAYAIKVGEEVKKAEDMLEIGKVLGRKTAGDIIPLAVGGMLGAEFWPKVSDYYRTHGKKILKEEELVSPQVMYTEAKFPTAGKGLTDAQRRKLFSEMFKETKYDVPGYPGYKPTATPEVWSKLISKPGTSEVPGVYIGGKGLSKYFLKIQREAPSIYGTNIFSPYGKPTIYFIKPSSYKLAAASKLGTRAYGEAVITGMKTEVEAVITPDTLFKEIAKFGVDVSGRKVPAYMLDVLGMGEPVKGTITAGELYSSYYGSESGSYFTSASFLGGLVSSKPSKVKDLSSLVYSYKDIKISSVISPRKSYSQKMPSYKEIIGSSISSSIKEPTSIISLKLIEPSSILSVPSISKALSVPSSYVSLSKRQIKPEDILGLPTRRIKGKKKIKKKVRKIEDVPSLYLPSVSAVLFGVTRKKGKRVSPLTRSDKVMKAADELFTGMEFRPILK